MSEAGPGRQEGREKENEGQGDRQGEVGRECKMRERRSESEGGRNRLRV